MTNIWPSLENVQKIIFLDPDTKKKLSVANVFSLSFSLETYYRSRFRRPLTINHTRIHKGHHMAQLGKQIFILTSIQIDLKPVHKVQISTDDQVPFSDEAFNFKSLQLIDKIVDVKA